MKKFEEIENKFDELDSKVDLLDESKRVDYYNFKKNKYKDPDTYACLIYILMTFGVGYLYLGYYKRFFAQFALSVTSLIVLVSSLPQIETGDFNYGIVLSVIVLLFLLISDCLKLFKSQSVVAEFNYKKAEKFFNDNYKE